MLEFLSLFFWGTKDWRTPSSSRPLTLQFFQTPGPRAPPAGLTLVGIPGPACIFSTHLVPFFPFSMRKRPRGYWKWQNVRNGGCQISFPRMLASGSKLAAAPGQGCGFYSLGITHSGLWGPSPLLSEWLFETAPSLHTWFHRGKQFLPKLSAKKSIHTPPLLK